MNWKHESHRADEDGDEDDDEEDEDQDENEDKNDDEDNGDGCDRNDRNENPLKKGNRPSENSRSASSGRRVAARDSRAGEEDWTKRKKQNKTSKAEEAEEHKSKRRAKARRVEAGLRRK